jgi:hypothetical protein
MDKFKSMTLDDRINQMKEDYNTEWWRASKIDNYDLKNKVSRINYFSYYVLDADRLREDY